MFDCWRVLKNFMGDHVFSSFFQHQFWIVVEHVPYNFGREHPFCGSFQHRFHDLNQLSVISNSDNSMYLCISHILSTLFMSQYL